MRTWIRRLLAPPVFAEDEDKTRTAFLLHIILLVVLAAAGVFRILFFLRTTTQPPRIPILWLFIVLLLVTFFLLRRGYVRLASFLAIFSIWSVLVASAIINGGMRSAEFNLLIIPVLIAGLLLGRGAALVTVGLSSLAGVIMWWAEITGVMQVRIGTNNLLLLFMVHAIGFLVAAVLVTLAKGRIEAALARVQAELDERKRLEEMQRASQQQYEALVQSIDGIVWEVDAKTFKFTFISKQAEKILGYPRERWMTEPNFWANHLYPDDRDWAIAFCTAAVEHKENHQFEYRMIAADGRVVWLRDQVTVCMLEDQTLRLRGVMVDITERMKAEEALRLSESRYRRIVEQAPEAIVVADIDTGKFIDFNPQALALFKLSAEEIRNLGPVEMSPPLQPDGRPSREAAQDYLRQALAGATPVFEWLHCDAQGREVLCEVRLLQLPDESRRLIRGTITDITERKRAEEERQAHLRFLESLDQVNKALQGTNDLEQRMNAVLDVVLSIFNCDRAWLVYPLEPGVLQREVMLERTRPEFPGALALGIEVPISPDIVRVLRTDNPANRPVQFGPGAEYPIPAELTQQFHIQSQLAMAIYPKMAKPYAFGLHQCSYPRVWTSEEERLFQEIGRRLADALSSLLMFQRLQESERRLNEAQRVAQVGYWDRVLDTNHITWSDETFRIFGLQPQEHLSLTQFWEMIHPDDRHLLVQSLAQALAGGPRYEVEYRIIRPDGEVRVVHSQGDITRDETGQPRHLFGTVQDITERKKTEEQLRAATAQLRALTEKLRAAREEEGRRIAREIHDELGAALTSLRWELGRFDKAIAKSDGLSNLETLRERLAYMLKLADTTVNGIRRIASELRPSVLDDLGLAEAIEWQAQEFQARTGIRCHCKFALDNVALNPEQSTALFRIFQEALTNALRHAQATQIDVTMEKQEGKIVLMISDNGKGITAAQQSDFKSLGLLGMRERAHLVGAEIHISGSEDKGTVITVCVPASDVALA